MVETSFGSGRDILTGIAALAAAFLVGAALTRSTWPLTLTVLVWFGASGIFGGIYPEFVQRFQVQPNEFALEEPYIANNIKMTRLAYGIDAWSERQYDGEAPLTAAAIAADAETFADARLWDYRPLQATLDQLQTVRQYYNFADVDVDRYTINGEQRLVMLSARELNPQRAQQSSTWVNRRIAFTHGIGVAMVPVAGVSSGGLPQLIIRDIPPVSTDGAPQVTEPRIYFGELTRQYVIVHSSEPEFDYPLGNGNASTAYPEDRGIRLDSTLRRAMLAWELGDANILISGQITDDSRLLMHRQIQRRVAKIAPFLVLDSDPYIAVVDGHLIWMLSAYTTSTQVPYAQPSGILGAVNYVRNSVQITVDAQTGDMHLYLIDAQDPVAATWAGIFPGLFEADSAIPAAVRGQMRYPLDLFKIQSQLYLRYHITDPSVFFIGEDVWNIPTEKKDTKEQPIEPYYVTMALPDERSGGGRTEFVLIMPFTPRNRQNTVAWLAGRSDGANFGKLRAYRFPTEDLVFGPAQIEARIDQNPGISQQITLWNQSGSSVLRGNLPMGIISRFQIGRAHV